MIWISLPSVGVCNIEHTNRVTLLQKQFCLVACLFVFTDVLCAEVTAEQMSSESVAATQNGVCLHENGALHIWVYTHVE